MSNKNLPAKSLNLNVRGIEKSATIEINERANKLLEKGRQVFKLGLGQSPFPVPESVVEALKANAYQKDYLQTQGLKQLRREIAQYHNRMYNLQVRGQDVIIGPGSKELMFILQLAYYGDLVVTSPAWVSYEPQAKIIGRQVQSMPTTLADGWKIHPQSIRDICCKDKTRPRIIVLNYPGNPSGTTYSNDELKKIASEARKYEDIILSDEIYGGLNFKGNHVSIAKYYPEGTIISTGLSKWCGAGGWRLGCFIFPPSMHWLMKAMVAIASETYTTTSAPIQYAAIRAFKGGPDIEDYLFHTRRILSALGKKSSAMLRETGVKIAEPEGAFYLFPDFSPLSEKLKKKGVTTSRELCEKCIDETGVAFLPGSSFGRPESELTARLAYVHFDGSRALAESRKIPAKKKIRDDFLDSFCRPALTGIERLCDWLVKM